MWRVAAYDAALFATHLPSPRALTRRHPTDAMVPVTIFVMSNLIYIGAKFFMQSDLDMYYDEGDECCQVRQMSLVEELGQVTHIFSDKTGTLTSNHMEFRRVTMDGITFGCGDTAISRSLRDRKGGGEAVTLSTKLLPPWAGCRDATRSYVSFEQVRTAHPHAMLPDGPADDA